MPGIALGINIAVGHPVQEQLQIGVAAGRQPLAVAGIMGIQPHLRLVGVGQTVAVAVHDVAVVAVRLQAGIAGDVNLLVVLGIVALVECHEVVVLLQGDVVGGIDDAHATRQAATLFPAGKLRVDGAGSLSQDAGIHLVVAGQRGSGLLYDGLERCLGTLVLQAAPLHHRLQDILVIGALRVADTLQVEGTLAAVADEAVQVVGIDLPEHVVFPDVAGGSPLAAELKHIAAEVPLADTIAIRRSHEIAVARGIVLGGRSRPEVVVNHIGTVVAVAALVVLAAIDAVGLAPVVDDIIDKLVVHMTVMGAGTDAVEARRAVVAAGKQAVVQCAVLAAPLGSIRTGTLGVARVVEALREDAPLDGGIVGVIHRQVLLHRPREGAMVQDDVVDVLHVEHRHALVGQVAGTEADMAHDAVGAELHLVASQADAAAGCRLSGDGGVALGREA